MKKYLIVPLLALVFSSTADGATDYYLKIDGVKGETTKAPARATTTGTIAAPKEEQEAQVDVFLKIEGVEGESDEISANDKHKQTIELDSATEEAKKKGNVEYNWKVEEGQKMMLEGGVAPDFDILVGKTDEEVAELAKSQTKIIMLLSEGMEEEGVAAEQISLNFEKIKTNIVVELEEEVKFLGVIPMGVKVEVDVDTTGEVKVKFPWWAFLASGKEDRLELGGRVYMALSNVMKTKHDTVKNSIQNVR